MIIVKSSRFWILCLRGEFWKKTCEDVQWKSSVCTHRIHVWCIYLHLVDFYGKCRWIYHTWILWGITLHLKTSVLVVSTRKLDVAFRFSRHLPFPSWWSTWLLSWLAKNKYQKKHEQMSGNKARPIFLSLLFALHSLRISDFLLGSLSMVSFSQPSFANKTRDWRTDRHRTLGRTSPNLSASGRAIIVGQTAKRFG